MYKMSHAVAMPKIIIKKNWIWDRKLIFNLLGVWKFFFNNQMSEGKKKCLTHFYK